MKTPVWVRHGGCYAFKEITQVNVSVGVKMAFREMSRWRMASVAACSRLNPWAPFPRLRSPPLRDLWIDPRPPLLRKFQSAAQRRWAGTRGGFREILEARCTAIFFFLFNSFYHRVTGAHVKSAYWSATTAHLTESLMKENSSHCSHISSRNLKSIRRLLCFPPALPFLN